MYLKNKLLSIGGDSSITDEHGQEIYYVDGAAISLGRRLTIKDKDHNEVGKIHQELIALTPTFEIHTESGKKAHISMRLLTLTDRMKIDVSGGPDLEVHGNLLHHEYDIERGGRRVAHVSKAWIALTNSYGIDIAEDEDQVLILASAVVIDEILEMREKADRD